MNILIVGTTDKRGGAAKISWDIKDALEKQGCAVSMFVADKLSNDSKVFKIPRQKWRKILGFLLSTNALLKTDWILKTREFREADIIHCHNLHGRFFNLKTLQKMSALKPVIWTLHDEWAITPHCALTFQGTEMKNGLFVCPNIKVPPRLLWDNTKYLSWRKNNIYKNSSMAIVTPSIWLKQRVEKTILKNQKIKIINNGINTKIFQPKNKKISRQKLNLPQDKKIILFLADNSKKSPWKGWCYTEKIIEKYKNRSDIIFLNVGNSEKPEDYGNVKFIKQTNDPEVISLYYNSADIFILTSLAENFPLAVLEAMACGVPVVSFDVGGIKEVLEHKKNGYLATYKDETSLLSGVKYILSLNKATLEEMKDASSAKIQENFNIEKMIREYVFLYKKLLK